jgi:hypothetical protein
MTIVPYPQSQPQAAAIARPSWLEVMDRGLELAEIIANTDFVPRGLRGNQAAILAAILYGHEVGLEPMTSLSTIAVIDGKPTMSAEAQRALILAAGHELVLEESTNTRATWAGRRRGERTTTRVTWTLDDARRAKLAGRPAYQAYPAAMLSARSSAALARAVFPDVIRGMAATEEIEGEAIEVESVVEDAEAPKQATRRRRRVATTVDSSATVAAPPAPEPSADSSPEATSAEPGPEQASAPVGEQPTAVEPDAPLSSQLGLMFHLFGKKGPFERDERLAYCERVLDRKINSSKELSALDVTRIIEALNAEPDSPAAPAANEGEQPAPAASEGEKPEASALPADEQAVMDALADELDAKPVDDPFPEGF